MDKNSARQLALSRVAALSLEERRVYSSEIFRLLRMRLCLSDIKSAFVFMSTKNEPDTRPIIDWLLKGGVTVYVPKIEGGKMSLTRYTGSEKTIKGAFGIIELDEVSGTELYDVNLNIVPLVAYDGLRNRVGHGKGYYDRYLARATGKSVAIAFSSQEVDEIEADEYDIRPMEIITEKGIIK